ncbi:MarR family winged helix-turn-helix transcriptional regulator [Labrys wisconsinensis]|uniref:MarR family transcriptional regulator for hemolysin n=1 Tax=Labrys wisconsinensis TaxID=425677 RepID=A0ABU0JGH4_9HYPH|nr:MarR family transcriptional regulator [Labrys wisconsinensis]MDQ0473374.1 MarR family transcriptional regulator for hemolysin [Labrys wisconsinensis]
MTELDVLRFSLTSALPKVGRYWRRTARDLVLAHGISEACAMPLISIGRMGDGVRQVAVAEEIGVEGPSLVRLLDQLCASGLVERRDDAADRRAKTLWLTPEGRRITGEIERGLVVLRAQVLRDVARGDLEATLRVFRAFEEAVGRAQEAPQQPGEPVA